MRQILVQSSLATFTIARNEGQREIVRILGDEVEIIELPGEFRVAQPVATTEGIAFQGPLTEDGLRPLYFHDGRDLTHFYTAQPSTLSGMRSVGRFLLFGSGSSAIASDGTSRGVWVFGGSQNMRWQPITLSARVPAVNVSAFRSPFQYMGIAGISPTDGYAPEFFHVSAYDSVVRDGKVYGRDVNRSKLSVTDGLNGGTIISGYYGSQAVDRGDHFLFWKNRAEQLWLVDDNDVPIYLGIDWPQRLPDTSRVGDIWYGTAQLSHSRDELRLFRRVENGEVATIFEFPWEFSVSMWTEDKPKNAPLFYELGTNENSGLWALDGGILPELIRESAADIESHRYTPAGLFFPENSELWASDGTTAGTKRIEVEGFDDHGQLRTTDERTFFVAEPEDGTVQLWNAESVPQIIVDAGSGYVLPEGDLLRLRPMVSGASGTLTYEWDLDADGEFEFSGNDVSWGVVRRMMGTQGAWPISVRVTDESGLSVSDTTSVLIENKPPTYEPVSRPEALTEDQLWEFTLNAFDVDELTYSVDFGDGSGPIVQRSPSFSHAWQMAGTYRIRVEITDGETDGRAAESFQVDVLPAGDVNLDGEVNIDDFLALSANFNRIDATRDDGDLDDDGVVNVRDFLILSKNYGRSVG